MYKFLKNEKGSAAIEYSLLVSLIGLVLAGVLLALGPHLHDAFSSINGSFISVLISDDSQK
jgi:Flp pilus assembly pilin Flp